jgi:hypothetical protein
MGTLDASTVTSRFTVFVATALAVAGCGKKDGADPFKDARVGNAVLTLPEGIASDSLKHMKALANCTRGVLIVENRLCFGEGELFHNSAELAVAPARRAHTCGIGGLQCIESSASPKSATGSTT